MEEENVKIENNLFQEKLTLVGLISDAPADARVTAIAKTVTEATRRRCRFLVWPRILNKRHDYKPQVYLKTPDIVVDEVLQCTTQASSCRAMHFDLKCAFHQHDIGKALRQHLVFIFRGKKYQMCRLPMGSRFSPEVQQRITTWLANVAVDRLTNKVAVTVHIDNVRYYGITEHVELAAKSFVEVCSQFNIISSTESP